MSWQPDHDLSSDLLAAFQSRFGISSPPTGTPALSTNTKVLDSASYVADQSIDVFISRDGLLAAAQHLATAIRTKPFTTASWAEHELHPDPAAGGMTEDEIVRFVFMMDLLNFSFWSDDESAPFEVEYRGRMWRGYWSLVAGLRRALEEGIPVTEPTFWGSKRCTGKTLAYVFAGGEAGARKKPKWLRREHGELAQAEGAGHDSEHAPADVRGNETHDEANVDESRGDPEPESNVQGEDGTVSNDADIATDNDLPDAQMQEDEQQPIELPTHDTPTVERQAEAGLLEPRPPDRVIPDTAETEDDDDSDQEQTGLVMPLLEERLKCLKEAAEVILKEYDGSVMKLVKTADKSAGRLVNLLARDFACFDDKHDYEGYRIRFYKRAQIFIGDLWACFQGRPGTPGEFEGIDSLTAFADYRIPQMLHTLGVLSYSPPLDARIRRKDMLESGGSWEVQLRGCSVWAVELLKKEIQSILNSSDSTPSPINAVLLDFYLYDSMKALEASYRDRLSSGEDDDGLSAADIIPHHRTRSIWY